MSKKILKHLKQAHAAVQKGNIKQGRYHIGHALAASNFALKNPGVMNDDDTDPPTTDPTTDQDDDTMSGQNWIAGAVKHPGALHRELEVPQGETIPTKKIDAAANSDNPTLARRANLAKTLKKLHGGKK